MSDSAFFSFSKAKDLFLQQKDSLGAGKCLVHMSIIAANKGDYYGAQEISLSALAYLDLKNKFHFVALYSNFNNLGIATYNLEDYEAAVKFYNSAIKFSNNPKKTLTILNNKAKTYEVMEDYTEALKLYDLVLKRTPKNSVEYARTLTNISHAKWLKDPNYNPVPSYLLAFRIRKNENDIWGQNSSYAHLSDYYSNKRTDSALIYAALRYQTAKKLNSAADKITALQKLIEVSPPGEIKGYFDSYKKLNDSVQTAHLKSKNQFALVRYETEKHKADFLKAQADNILKQNDILRRNIIVGVLAAVLIIGYWWFRKRKKSLQQEKELEVKNTEIKYVKKIHDRVANKVYQVMSEVENTPKLDRNSLIDKLELLYNISRDISYEVLELSMDKNYVQQLSKMLKSYESNKVGIITVGNEDELWDAVSAAARFEIFYIIQELLTNMRKHSRADSVLLKFHRKDSQIHISYLDNGIGMREEAKKNGLTNTENRIKLIRGTITFDSTQENEFKIDLIFPIS